jgi:hypothetical protein
MKALATTLASCCLALAALGAHANEATKKDDPMTTKTMTLDECKQHVSMQEKNAEKKSDPKNDKMCADMIKKDTKMMKGGMSSDPMKK